MSRKMLITLIVVMIAVLSGLIFVQTTMIKSASDIREEQFNQLVKNSLLLVSAQLNQLEEREARMSAQQQKLLFESGNSENFNIFPRNNKVRGTLSLGIQILEEKQTRFIREEYSINIQDTSGLATDSLTSDQLFQIQQHRKSEEWLRNIDWYNYKIRLEDRSIEERIDSTMLDRLLKSAIAETGINIDFKYAIKNSGLARDSIIFGNLDYSPGRQKEFYQRLFLSDFDGPKANYLNK